MVRFLIALMYTPRNLGGLDMKQFSVTVQQIKPRMLTVSLADKGRQKDTAGSLLSWMGQ